MQAWIRSRSKTRKDGRMVFITSVVFDAHVFNELCNRVHWERHRSAIVTEAVRDALSRPGWVEAALLRISGEEHAADGAREVPSRDAPSSNSRVHARSAGNGPATRRSPASRPPRSRTAPSSSGRKNKPPSNAR